MGLYLRKCGKKMDVETSDLDVLIIVSSEKNVKGLQDKMTELTSSIFTGFGLSLSPVILTDFQWRKGKQFQELKKNVIQDHIPLVGEMR